MDFVKIGIVGPPPGVVVLLLGSMRLDLFLIR